MMTIPLHFHPVNPLTRPLVEAWLLSPHVAEYFHGEGLENTLKDLQRFMSGGDALYTHWIAYDGRTPFAYLMTSKIDPNEEDAARFTPRISKSDHAITLDLFIGDPAYLGKGLAADLIRRFLLSATPVATRVFIDPESANSRAIHVYEKAGFVKLHEFIAPWNPVPHWLMTVQTAQLRHVLQVDGGIALRLLGTEDAPTLFHLVDSNRNYLAKYLNWLDFNRSIQDSTDFIEEQLIDFAAGTSLVCGVWSNDRLLGLVGFVSLDSLNRTGSIGYWLAEDQQGKGIMTRSVQALVDHGFSHLNLQRIEIRCATENAESQQIPKRLGFDYEGTLKQVIWHPEGYQDALVYARMR